MPRATCFLELRPVGVLVDPDKIELQGWLLGPIPMRPEAGSLQHFPALRARTAPGEIRSDPRPLLPRPHDGGWTLPALVAVRLPPGAPIEGDRMPLSGALAALAKELGDPSLVDEGIRAFAEMLRADEFLSRVTGEPSRAGHAARTMSCMNGASMVPWVIASLPDEFSLTELHRSVIACMGAADSPSAARNGRGSSSPLTESPSNFRRRVTDLVMSGVLKEVSSGGRPTESDRPGRPPRMFRFSREAWHAWLLRRSGTAADDHDSFLVPAAFAMMRNSEDHQPDAISTIHAAANRAQHRKDSEAAARAEADRMAARLQAMSMAARLSLESDRPKGARDDEHSQLFMELAHLLRKYSPGQ